MSYDFCNRLLHRSWCYTAQLFRFGSAEMYGEGRDALIVDVVGEAP